MINYTIGFIRHGDRLLLLNRRYAPNMGLWNGVGGKIEAGESPIDAILREIKEETGLQLPQIRFAGIVTWGERYDQVRGGMYAFLGSLEAPVPEGPIEVPEGILAWKPLSWVTDPLNQGVVPSLPRFLPVMFRDPTPYRHHCIYGDGRLRVCVRHTIPEDWPSEA